MAATRRRHPYLGAPPVPIAHRGGTGYAPNAGIENSLAAFERSVELGYDHVETDVHTTADGVVVALHDDRLDRVSDARGAVAGLTFAQVREARLGGREPVPSLEEVLRALPDTFVNIDLKDEASIEATWAVVRECGAQARVCVASFSNRRIWRFRGLTRRTRIAGGHRVATAAGRLGVACLRWLPWGVSRYLHTPAIAYQVPVEALVLGRRVTVVTREFVERAHRLGKDVQVWTVDDPAEMTRLLDLGVDAIMTDRIDVLRDLLIARGSWRGRQP